METLPGHYLAQLLFASISIPGVSHLYILVVEARACSNPRLLTPFLAIACTYSFSMLFEDTPGTLTGANAIMP